MIPFMCTELCIARKVKNLLLSQLHHRLHFTFKSGAATHLVTHNTALASLLVISITPCDAVSSLVIPTYFCLLLLFVLVAVCSCCCLHICTRSRSYN